MNNNLSSDINNQVNSNIDNDNVNSNKKGISKVGLFLIIISFILIGLGFGYNTLFKSNRNIVKYEMSSFFTTSKNVLSKARKNIFEYDLDKDILNVKGVLKADSNYKDEYTDYTKLKDYELSYSGILSVKDNALNSFVSLKNVNNNTSIIDSNIYFEKDKAYLYLKDIYDKIISYDLDMEVKDFNVDDSKFDKYVLLLNKVESFTEEWIKDKDISEEKVEKEINKEKKKYLKIVYKLDIDEYIKELFTSFKNDQETMNLLKDIFDEDKKEIEDMLDEVIKNNQDGSKKILTINTYVEGLKKDVREIELITDNEIIVIDFIDNNIEFVVKSKDEEICKGTYNTDDGLLNVYNENVNFKYQYKNDSTVINLTYKMFDDSKYIIDIVNKLNVGSNSEKIDTTLGFKYQSSTDDMSFNISNNVEIKKADTIDKPTITDSTNIDDMSYEEIEKIENNISNRFNIIANDINMNLDDVNTTFFRKIF